MTQSNDMPKKFALLSYALERVIAHAKSYVNTNPAFARCVYEESEKDCIDLRHWMLESAQAADSAPPPQSPNPQSPNRAVLDALKDLQEKTMSLISHFNRDGDLVSNFEPCMKRVNEAIAAATQADEVKVIDGLVVDRYRFVVRPDIGDVFIEDRGNEKWVISLRGEVLNKQGEWEYEPLPSNRDDEFIERTRFDSPESCLEHLKRQKGR